jgi:hypothetical protein
MSLVCEHVCVCDLPPPDHTIPYSWCICSQRRYFRQTCQAVARGGRTVREAGLKLVCRHCGYVVEGSAIIIRVNKPYKAESVVAHPKDERCPRASVQRKWSISSDNWKLQSTVIGRQASLD